MNSQNSDALWVLGIRPGACQSSDGAELARSAISFALHAVQAVAYHDARGPSSLASEYGLVEAGRMRRLARLARLFPGLSLLEGWAGEGEDLPWVACDPETEEPYEPQGGAAAC